MTTKQSEFFFLLPTLQENVLKWLPDFDLLLTSYDYLTLTFHWFISVGQNTFYPAKFSILARKMRNNARQTY